MGYASHCVQSQSAHSWVCDESWYHQEKCWPQINVEAGPCDISFYAAWESALYECGQETLAKIAASATGELENIVTPSNCVAVTVSQKEVASAHVACWKPKPRCGMRPLTKIRNVQSKSHAPHSDNALFTWMIAALFITVQRGSC